MAEVDRAEAARRRLETLERAKRHNARGLQRVAAQIAKHPDIRSAQAPDSSSRRSA